MVFTCCGSSVHEGYVRFHVVCAVRTTLLVGGTDTSCRHWSPTSPFPVSHSSEPRPRSLEVPGMGLRPCGPQMRRRFGPEME
ncbi:hypothetical protein Taro_012441 [Colocasia esculenta]|uniref:Uncharacterized protein n=1 Tax=Colocasia esculenta TaxID=4460 RepID=A0A843UJ66_COLES|nr:hypothetical protein [Colocasia esculenta]